MKRSLVALSALFCLAAPAFADACSAATEAASRAALDNAKAAGRRTAIVRVQCDGERQTFVLQRVGGASGSSITVRELKSRGGEKALAGAPRGEFKASSQTRVIRVGD